MYAAVTVSLSRRQVKTDARGQQFNVTGRLIPSHFEYRRSISTIEIAKIPEWEWPMRFEAPENVVETVVDGVVVTLSEEVLKIDDMEIELENAIE